MTRTKLALSMMVVALALVGLAVALPAAATTDGATNVQTQANETPPPNGSFDQDIYEVQKGQVVAIDVSINNTDTALVQIGGQEKSYVLNATVTDGNGDNQVQLQFDTSAAGSTGSVITTFSDADSVTVEKLDSGDGEFEGSYGMILFHNGTQLASAAMAVQAQETTTTTTTTTTTSTTTTSMDPTDTTTSDGQPGFGVVAALVAVAAAALAATRR